MFTSHSSVKAAKNNKLYLCALETATKFEQKAKFERAFEIYETLINQYPRENQACLQKAILLFNLGFYYACTLTLESLPQLDFNEHNYIEYLKTEARKNLAVEIDKEAHNKRFDEKWFRVSMGMHRITDHKFIDAKDLKTNPDAIKEPLDKLEAMIQKVDANTSLDIINNIHQSCLAMQNERPFLAKPYILHAKLFGKLQQYDHAQNRIDCILLSCNPILLTMTHVQRAEAMLIQAICNFREVETRHNLENEESEENEECEKSEPEQSDETEIQLEPIDIYNDVIEALHYDPKNIKLIDLLGILSKEIYSIDMSCKMLMKMTFSKLSLPELFRAFQEFNDHNKIFSTQSKSCLATFLPFSAKQYLDHAAICYEAKEYEQVHFYLDLLEETFSSKPSTYEVTLENWAHINYLFAQYYFHQYKRNYDLDMLQIAETRAQAAFEHVANYSPALCLWKRCVALQSNFVKRFDLVHHETSTTKAESDTNNYFNQAMGFWKKAEKQEQAMQKEKRQSKYVGNSWK